MPGWDGQSTDPFFSATLVRYVTGNDYYDNYEYLVAARYYCRILATTDGKTFRLWSQALTLNMHDQPHKGSHEEARSSQRYRRYHHHRRPHRVPGQHTSRRQQRSCRVNFGTHCRADNRNGPARLRLRRPGQQRLLLQ